LGCGSGLGVLVGFLFSLGLFSFVCLGLGVGWWFCFVRGFGCGGVWLFCLCVLGGGGCVLGGLFSSRVFFFFLGWGWGWCFFVSCFWFSWWPRFGLGFVFVVCVFVVVVLFSLCGPLFGCFWLGGCLVWAGVCVGWGLWGCFFVWVFVFCFLFLGGVVVVVGVGGGVGLCLLCVLFFDLGVGVGYLLLGSFFVLGLFGFGVFSWGLCWVGVVFWRCTMYFLRFIGALFLVVF